MPMVPVAAQPPREVALPRAALLGAALLVAFALGSVALARLRHWQGTPMPVAQPFAVLHLQFTDRDDGAIEVLDADAAPGGVHIATIAPRSNGFMRGVLRGLARARRNEHLADLGTPFTLTRWSDGRLTLADAATGRNVPIEVFGPDNARPFAALFAARTPVSATSRSTQP